MCDGVWKIDVPREMHDEDDIFEAMFSEGKGRVYVHCTEGLGWPPAVAVVGVKYLVVSNKFLNFVLKGRSNIDQELNQISYVQLRENKWTFNDDISRRWNVTYNL
ncbi:hypothetical protein Tco_1233921 [Tanacetum coccineum]